MLEIRGELDRMKKRFTKMQRELYSREDEIDARNDELQDVMREKLRGNSRLERILTIAFTVE